MAAAHEACAPQSRDSRMQIESTNFNSVITSRGINHSAPQVAKTDSEARDPLQTTMRCCKVRRRIRPRARTRACFGLLFSLIYRNTASFESHSKPGRSPPSNAGSVLATRSALPSLCMHSCLRLISILSHLTPSSRYPTSFAEKTMLFHRCL